MMSYIKVSGRTVQTIRRRIKAWSSCSADGMRFYTGDMFPSEYTNSIFIARHGSWNRSTPIGYRVMLATVEGNKVVKREPFADGCPQGTKVPGRPVDMEIAPTVPCP